MPLLSKVVNLSPLLNSRCLLLVAPRIKNGVGACRITVKEQCPKFLIPPIRRLFTHLASPHNKNTSSRGLGRLLFSTTFKTKPFATPKSVAKFHARDGLSPKSFTLIYKSDFQWYLVVAQTTVLLAIASTIVVVTAAYLDSQLPPEEKAKRAAENRARIMESEKNVRNEFKLAAGVIDVAPGPEVVDNLPSMADVISEDLDFIGIFLVMLIALGLTIFRLMTMLPLRVYVGQKVGSDCNCHFFVYYNAVIFFYTLQHHCVGVYYGSLLPGKLVRQEFVAGTVTAQKSMLGAGNAYYKDGSGRGMMLFDHHFRKPADLHYLTGVTKSFADDEEDELNQFKRIGEYGSSESKR